MPASLIDRLPLPNLKVYTAGSVLLLSLAVYHASIVTSDPNWRSNSSVQRHDSPDANADMETVKIIQPLIAHLDATTNSTRNVTEQFVEVLTYMLQEPLCMWTLINLAYCCLTILGYVIQRAVFGRLRVSEVQRVKDKFWNYVFYKFIFMFGVINVQYMDEVVVWCSWFTAVGFLQLLSQLCKDRLEYLASSGGGSRPGQVRVACLLGGVVAGGVALLAAAAQCAGGRATFLFMGAECVLLLLGALHAVARLALLALGADAAGPRAYYTHLSFEWSALLVEVLHVLHMVVWSNVLLSLASLVLLMQLRHLLHELQSRLRRHRLYTELASHMSRHYPMASPEEVASHEDNCAICWEPMKEARKLPCDHLFHNSCLCQWVQQDASCPTCRRPLSARPRRPPPAPPSRAAPQPPPLHNHLFHFDGSRYVSWLPSFSVEVSRVGAVELEAMARQVHAVFPQFPRGALLADLAATRSPHLTLDNILEGRLLPPAPVAASPATATPAPATPSATRASSAEGFADSAEERQELLRRRKQSLLNNARQRYLARAPPSASASPRT